MENGNTKIYAIYITIIIILLLGITGIFLYFNKSTSPSRAAIKESTKQTTSTKNQKAMPTMKEMPMTAVTPSPVSEQQKEQLDKGTSTDTTKKTFDITGGDFYFTPNKITVNKGDQVTFVMTNAGGIHDLVIDELGVKTPITHTGDKATVTFTASTTGSFVYYCSLPGHRAKGMWGTLVVQ